MNYRWIAVLIVSKFDVPYNSYACREPGHIYRYEKLCYPAALELNSNLEVSNLPPHIFSHQAALGATSISIWFEIMIHFGKDRTYWNHIKSELSLSHQVFNFILQWPWDKTFFIFYCDATRNIYSWLNISKKYFLYEVFEHFGENSRIVALCTYMNAVSVVIGSSPQLDHARSVTTQALRCWKLHIILFW